MSKATISLFNRLIIVVALVVAENTAEFWWLHFGSQHWQLLNFTSEPTKGKEEL